MYLLAEISNVWIIVALAAVIISVYPISQEKKNKLAKLKALRNSEIEGIHAPNDKFLDVASQEKKNKLAKAEALRNSELERIKALNDRFLDAVTNVLDELK